ncbi:MAG: head GIN domain-containing protein, partial [Bacteroidota bacterium]
MKAMKTYPMILITMMIMLTSCTVLGEQGSGNVTKQERKVSSFDRIDVSGAYDVFITQGDVQSVFVEADDNLLPLIKTEVNGSTLSIENRKSIHNPKCLKVYITVKELKKIEMSGAVDLTTEGKFTENELEIEISGATNAKLDLAVQKLGVSCSGGCKLNLKGMANSFNLDGSGAVDVFAYDMLTESVSIEI